MFSVNGALDLPPAASIGQLPLSTLALNHRDARLSHTNARNANSHFN